MSALVLVVEDDDSLRPLLRRMLEKEGYSVEVATNGKEGIKKAEELKPDLLITDIMMPEMNGIAAIMELKNEHPDIKIIAMSGGGAIPGDHLEIASKLGVHSVFAKPIRRKEFLKEVKKALLS